MAVPETIENDVLPPAQITWLSGCVVMAGPAPGVIINVISLVWVGAPEPVPVTVTVHVPEFNAAIPVNDTVVDGEPVVNGLLLNDTVGPAGLTVPLKVIGPLKVPW